MRQRLVSLLAVAVLLLSLVTGCAPSPAETAAEDIVVLFTNDVHCGIEDDIGYAGLLSYKAYVQEQTPYVTLVDCGDAIQGEFIGTVSEGAHLIDIMNRVGYDAAILGNHEFDYGMEQLKSLIGKASYPYLSCNIEYTGSGENALSEVDPYILFDYGETTVAFIGVATPESLTKSTPTYFMENGEYVYSFLGGDDGTKMFTRVQGYVDECREKGADYVVVLSHLGDMEESAPFTSVDLIRNTVGVDAVLDGHAHNVIPCRIEKNKSGEEVLLSSTGTKLDTIGQLVISPSGNVTVGLISDYADKDADFERYYATIRASYESEMNAVVATSDIALTGYSESGARMVRNRETTIGNLCADAYRAVTGADIAVVNGGGVRADLPAGDITYADILEIHPFGNNMCMVHATGQEILDSLEVAYREVQAVAEENGVAVGEEGSFQHISGMKCTIDTSIPHSVTFDENGMLVSIGDTRRVKDAYVLDANGVYVPLDPAATYKFASHNYLIRESGGGINVFADNELLIAEGISDYQALTVYITEHLGGKLSEKYADVEGRITVE
ncbi:MAG: bifunctional metallophosphatase/5'-nucleotidase [Clostridia bacterium]|nr:bifunctional metallophosphatase/5'-nucleotidase [Clostridia bacterium]